jgi:tryptophan synthase beta chain
VIGKEARAQMLSRTGRLPDLLVAASAADRTRSACSTRSSTIPIVKMLGVEAAATGSTASTPPARGRRPASSTATRPTCCRTRTARSPRRHSISAGLDYPGIGPEHSWLQRKRPRRLYQRHRHRGAGRVPAAAAAPKASSPRWNPPTRSPRSLTPTMDEQVAPRMDKDQIVLVNLCARGDKDIFTVAEATGGRWAHP